MTRSKRCQPTPTALLLAASYAASAVAAGDLLWQTSAMPDRVWSREAGAAKLSVEHDAVRVVHRGHGDWALRPHIAIPPLDGIAEMSVPVSAAGEGKIIVGFLRIDSSGRVLEWSYRSTSARSTSNAVLRSRARLSREGERLEARIFGVGPGEFRAGPLTVSVHRAPPPAPQSVVSISNRQIAVTLDPARAALTLRDLRNGQSWSTAAESDAWTAAEVRAGPQWLEWRLADDLGDSTWTARLELDGDRPEARIVLTPLGGAQTPMPRPLAYPPALLPDPPAPTELILPMNEGIGFPTDDPAVPAMRLIAYGGHGICMAFSGITVGESACMLLLETPDDAAVKLERHAGHLRLIPEWDAQTGAAGYPRVLRFVLFNRGGYVAMCHRYREWVREQGRLVTLREKLARNPNVELLAGAANVWFMDRDRTNMARELAAAGMDRVLWSAGGTAEDVAAINALGFLTSRYDIYQDLMDPAQFPKLPSIHRDWTTDAWPTGIIRRADGDWVRGWRVRAKDGTMISCAVLCDRLAPDWARRRIREDLAHRPFRARFIDTTTATPWRECYDPHHPMTRTESRAFKMELLKVVSHEFNLVCGSETGHDAAVPFVHYFEGMLSLGPFRVPDAGRDMMRKWTEVPERVARFQTGHRYRLPLWELVYHDCVVAQWYWGDYNNKLPALWRRRDLWNALYGTPPMYMFNRAEWNQDRDRFLESYRIATPVHRRTMLHPMINHRRLTPDGSVQQSVFGDGTVVTVNFGEQPWRLPDGRELAPETADITGGAPPAPVVP